MTSYSANRPRAVTLRLCVLLLSGFWTVSFRAQSLSPVRDNPKARIGSAVVSGTVVADDTSGGVLRRVIVTLQAGESQSPRTAVTDDQGRFVFDGLSPGTYSLMAQRAGFVRTYFGSRRVGRDRGTPFSVSEGQTVAGITIRMARGSVIAGTIRSASGRPIAGLRVVAAQVRNVDGQRQVEVVSSANIQGMLGTSTNDIGEYRVFGLSPGDYVVQARGSGLQVHTVSEDDVRWAEESVRTQRIPASAGVSRPPLPPPIQTATFASVFFPGVTDISAAAVIKLGPAEERAGMDFTTILVPTVRVAGTVLGPDGLPRAGAQVSLRSLVKSSAELTSLGLGSVSNATSQPDGSFAISNVPPGRYSLSTRVPLMQAADARGSVLWAARDLQVDGQDHTDVLLSLTLGVSISGKVRFEGTSPLPTDPRRAKVMLTSTPVTGGSLVEIAASLVGGSLVSVDADWTFSMKGISPGRYRFMAVLHGLLDLALPATEGWFLKSISLNGYDISDRVYGVDSDRDLEGVIVTFTDRPTALLGTVRDKDGRPSPGFPIVVFSTDRGEWAAGSRRVREVAPSSDGEFKIIGLPAGDYYVSAVTELDPEDLADPDFLEQLAAMSFKVTLAEGERKIQDIKLVGGWPAH